MKTEVYSWRLSADKKAELEGEARRERTSLSALLEKITTDWLNARRGQGDDAADEAAIRKRAAAAIGAIRGGDPTRASRASELVREMISRKHTKESSGSRRTD
jgi:hypothetical protein